MHEEQKELSIKEESLYGGYTGALEGYEGLPYFSEKCLLVTGIWKFYSNFNLCASPLDKRPWEKQHIEFSHFTSIY